MEELTPKEIVKKLDEYIVGQDQAKKAVAIALRNRWRRRQANKDLQEDILPNNIIMIGPTGVGKTEIARRLAKLTNAPFIKVEATKFTEVGYVGRDVESIIRDLVGVAINLVTEEHEEKIWDEAEKAATEKILKQLIPHENIETEKARKKLKTLYEKGNLDNLNIILNITENFDKDNISIMGNQGTDFELPSNFLSKAFKNVFSEKISKKMNIYDAKLYLTENLAEALIDKSQIIDEALDRVENEGIVFIDEIDKIAVNSERSTHGPDISRQGVQRDLLPIVEGSSVNTKYGIIRTDHILFIASGAFHISKPSDLIPELQGRFPIRAELQSLSVEDFYNILKHPKNAPIKQYQALLAAENIDLIFDDDAIIEIAKKATQVNEDTENIGARRLHTIITKILDEIMFNAPDGKKTITINSKFVKEKLASILENKDLSQYIL